MKERMILFKSVQLFHVKQWEGVKRLEISEPKENQEEKCRL